MNPNDVAMVRAYSRMVGQTIIDETFPEGTNIEIAVDCEAGSVIHGLGPPYELTIYVRDLMENHEIDYTATISGNLGDPPDLALVPPYEGWPDQAQTHKFEVPAGPPPLQKGHIFDVLAVLTVGVADPIVSFAESNKMVIT